MQFYVRINSIVLDNLCTVLRFGTHIFWTIKRHIREKFSDSANRGGGWTPFVIENRSKQAHYWIISVFRGWKKLKFLIIIGITYLLPLHYILGETFSNFSMNFLKYLLISEICKDCKYLIVYCCFSKILFNFKRLKISKWYLSCLYK